MKTILPVLLVIAALLTAAANADIRDVDYGGFREVDLLSDPQVHELRTYDQSSGYGYAPGRATLGGGYVVFGFEPNRGQGDPGGDAFELDNISCAYYSPWSAQAASLELDYSGMVRISISSRPRGGQWRELYTGGAGDEGSLTLPIPPAYLNTAAGHRCEFYLRIEQLGSTEVVLDEASLSWETRGYNTSYQPNIFYTISGGVHAFSEGYRRYETLLNDLQPGCINQHVMWGWVQPSYWPWHWVYDEDDWDGYNNYYDITADTSRFEEYEIEIGARYDMARMLRFYSGVDDYNYPEPVSAANLPTQEFWIQPDIQEPARWVSFGNDAVDDLNRDLTNPGKYPVWHPGLIWYVSGDARGYKENGRPYYGFSLNNRFYSPLYPYTKEYWERYRADMRAIIYADSRRNDDFYRSGDEYFLTKDKLRARWVSADYPGTNFRLDDLDENNIHLGGTKVVPIVDDYVGWSPDTPDPQEPTAGRQRTPTVRHFIEYTVEELETVTAAERRNYPDASGEPYFQVGMVRDDTRRVTDCNIAGYLMTNEPAFHGGREKHLWRRSGSDHKRVSVADDEYYPPVNGYNIPLEEAFDDWLLDYYGGPDHLSDAEVWADSGYDSIGQLNAAWGTDYRDGQTIPLPVRVVALDPSAPRPTAGDFALEPDEVRFNSWERRLFNYLRADYNPGSDAYLLGGSDGVDRVSGGQLRMWYDYMRYLHHTWERYLVWAPGVFNGALDQMDRRRDIAGGESRLGRRVILGSETAFHQAWNSKLGAQHDPRAFNTAAIGVNPHNAHWAHFVSYLRAGQCAASDDPADPFGYYPVYFSEFANGYVTNPGGSWRMLHSIADIAIMSQYMNLFDVRLGFWHNLLEIWADDGHYLGEPGRWDPDTYADELYEYYSTPNLDLHLDREAEILVLFDPPSIACGDNADLRGGHERISALLIENGYLCDTWRSFRFRGLDPRQGAELARRYKLIIIPDWYIMDDGGYAPLGCDELAILEEYLDHGGRVLLFDSVGLWSFDNSGSDRGRIVPEIPEELYGDCGRPREEYYNIKAPRGYDFPDLEVQRDLGYLGTDDDSLTLSNGTNHHPGTDYNNNAYEGDGDNGGIFLTHLTGDPAFSTLLRVEGYGNTETAKDFVGTIDTSRGRTPYGNVLYCGTRFFPYTAYGDGQLIHKLLYSAARWAGIDNSVSLTEPLVTANAGFENSIPPWRIVKESSVDGLGVEYIDYTDEGITGYGERGLKLVFGAGGYYTSSSGRPRLEDQVGIGVRLADMLPDQELIPGRQYHLYLDARVADFNCPVNQSEYNEDRGSLTTDAPYLGVYIKEPGGEFKLHWVVDLIAEHYSQSRKTILGDWHRYDVPLVLPYPEQGRDLGQTEIRFVLSGELQLLRERDRVHGSNDEVSWQNNEAEFANTTVYLDNVCAIDEFITADTYVDDGNSPNHGHAHDLRLSADQCILMAIDEDAVPLSSGAERVKLRFHVDDFRGEASRIDFRLIGASWEEDIQRESRSLEVPDVPRAAVTIDGRGFHEADLTALFTYWRTHPDEGYHGICLSLGDGSAKLSIDSRETWEQELRPRIILE